VECGNGVVDPGETCDPPSTCPTGCDDGDACTADTLTGSAATCDALCSNVPIVACQGGDNCCPAGCNSGNDGDCPANCGNGVLDPGETCDPPSTCPTGCDDGDACTTDTLGGSATTCDAVCSNSPIVACQGGDGCCPPGCNSGNDGDCPANCGNGVLDPGETCDPPTTCPTGCDDGDACTADSLGGSATTCDARCSNLPIVACQGGDSCCPAGCNSGSDGDCSANCGNGVLDPGETCDPPTTCPTGCDDGDACTADSLGGSAVTCDAVCSNFPIATCQGGDGCCPASCHQETDADCEDEQQKAGCGCGSGGPASGLWAVFLVVPIAIRQRRKTMAAS
jgi:MYXO-CTERM domain-containing protein